MNDQHDGWEATGLTCTPREGVTISVNNLNRFEIDAGGVFVAGTGTDQEDAKHKAMHAVAHLEALAELGVLALTVKQPPTPRVLPPEIDMAADGYCSACNEGRAGACYHSVEEVRRQHRMLRCIPRLDARIPLP